MYRPFFFQPIQQHEVFAWLLFLLFNLFDLLFDFLRRHKTFLIQITCLQTTGSHRSKIAFQSKVHEIGLSRYYRFFDLCPFSLASASGKGQSQKSGNTSPIGMAHLCKLSVCRAKGDTPFTPTPNYRWGTSLRLVKTCMNQIGEYGYLSFLNENGFKI